MIINQDIYKEILLEYEKLTDIAKKKIEIRKELYYEKCPRLKEIDDELNMIGIKLCKAVISASITDKKKYIQDIKTLSEKLKEEKQNLMIENGFSKNYSDDIYKCPKCMDTGFINNKKCDCFKQKLITKAYDMSNIAEILKTENFTKFDLNYYSKEKIYKHKPSPYENMKRIKNISDKFIKYFDSEFKNLLFYGDTGLGKTLVCNGIAKELLDNGKTVLYTSSFSLFKMFENVKFNRENEEINYDILNFTKYADLLIIDDLGTEFRSTLSLAELFNILNNRILNRKSTIISTNLTPNQIEENYSSRIISRLYGEYSILCFYGCDIRVNQKDKIK